MFNLRVWLVYVRQLIYGGCPENSSIKMLNEVKLKRNNSDLKSRPGAMHNMSTRVASGCF